MFDLHIHTLRSVDSKQTIDEVCESAIQKGLQGIAICDHVDMWFSEKLNTPEAIRLCVQDVRRAKSIYGDRLEILQGMEMAEYLFDPENADRILSLGEFDVILRHARGEARPFYEKILFPYRGNDRQDGF